MDHKYIIIASLFSFLLILLTWQLRPLVVFMGGYCCIGKRVCICGKDFPSFCGQANDIG